ncbi:YaaR family protein [Lentibacillus sp. Marseille-P4043]|uniref:YaaR family protein n=1 Tax=Lentibacillus sp. Marseille-P4043 TaxID=2040293 RepID=UPI000D0B535F|nr:YaaR family protein [Lentibacillus sp. Marseille-P4043]
MKISQEMRAQMDAATKNTRQNVDGKKSFDGIVQSQTQKLKQQEIQQLMKDITMQGDKLARFRSFRDLVKFKRMVKGFLRETVSSGLDLQKSHSFNLDGQSRKLAIIKTVDEKLIELTEEVMGQEKKTVDLLGLIGEIKGLLVNLYT